MLLNNGLMVFKVEKLSDTDAECRVIVGGELSGRKSMSFPGKVLKQKYLSEQDKNDIAFGVKNDIDFIACSFVPVSRILQTLKVPVRKSARTT